MAPKPPVTKYQYVVTAEGPKLMPADEPHSKDEESPAEYNAGGYLPVKVGDTFNNRYRVLRKLGWGHFSTVWLVKDTHTRRHSALKVVKSAVRYAETARDEIKLLSRVSACSPAHPGREHIVSFLDSFTHRVAPETSHICIVFEPLGENLLGLIERNKKKGVPRALVKVIAKQILLGLEYLHDECDLVHTDIKPENILISIPDIEAHIHNELSLSPSPTCRRVGIPFPTKSKSGVSIPPHHQRARKQVQIFESQPLASPRSTGSAAPAVSMSVPTQLEAHNVASTSQNGSYVAQMHFTRTGNCLSGTVGSLSSNGKLASLAASAQHTESSLLQKRTDIYAAKGITAVPPRIFNSPSTSSSSSSISSALASTTPGSSSLVSTPPTSLSNSLGNAMMEFMGTGKLASELSTRSKLSPQENKISSAPVHVSPASTVVPKKPKATIDLETQLSSAISSSWKATTEVISNSWKDKISQSFASDKSHSTPSKSVKPRHSYNRSHSGISNPGFWKDPGTAAPAPAILVSAVVSAGGQQDDFSKLSTVDSTNFHTSQGSSTTSTVRPSPLSTPLLIAKKSSSLIHSVSGLIKDTSSYFSGQSSPNSSVVDNSTRDTANSINQHLSLLTQTAPSRPESSSAYSNSTIHHVSPPQQVSQLSAHMYTHRPPSYPHSGGGKTKSHSSRHTQRSSTASVITMSSTSVTPTPACPTPPPPPSTPVDVVPIGAFIPPNAAALSSKAQQAGHGSQPIPIQQRILAPLTTPEEKVIPPSISIKIADLGNATPSKKHYTEEIQTRQYRSPEAILGRRDWDSRADIWSVACVLFELLTAEYLFEPQAQGELFGKDDDHMAQIIELLGDFPVDVKMGGNRSHDLFDSSGALRRIRTLKPWPLKRVMVEKYLFSESDATMLCDFLEPMLAVDMRQRLNARDLKDHAWLEVTHADGIVTDW